MNTQQNKIRGSLIGGAIGDALGYPVEFISSIEDIRTKYGQTGITRYDKSTWRDSLSASHNKAVVSDDTQMTLFTICGLLNAKKNGSNPVLAIQEAYLEWYFTQMGRRNPAFHECWIGEISELYALRAPGNTCLNALADLLRKGKTSNNSKGCGGVMRIAPVALYGAAMSRIADIKAVDLLAADASKLTHHHPLGYIPSALVAHVIYRLVEQETSSKADCLSYVKEGLDILAELYPQDPQAVTYFSSLMNKAILLADENADDASTIELHLGGGWTAEETVAIAIYCVLKYYDNFEKAIVAAVNHAGDSDSTGAVAGNILGAALGYETIPKHYTADLEFHDLILHMADDLYTGTTTPYKF